MVEWGDWIALAALAIAAALAVLRFVEWLARPRLEVDMDWLAATGEPTVLHVVIGNRGRARGGVRALHLSRTSKHDVGTAFSHYPMLSKPPAMVEPGDLALFTFEVRREQTRHTLTRSLLDGTFRYLIVVDERNARRSFPIPAPPDDDETRRNRYGRVAHR